MEFSVFVTETAARGLFGLRSWSVIVDARIVAMSGIETQKIGAAFRRRLAELEIVLLISFERTLCGASECKATASEITSHIFRSKCEARSCNQSTHLDAETCDPGRHALE
jgi:hypothetical protein